MPSQTAAALAELAKATGHTSSRDMMIDAAAFTIAMRDANIDKEFSGRLFEFLDEGARPPRLPAVACHMMASSRQALGSNPFRPGPR